MILNFPKIPRGKETASKLSEKYISEANPSERTLEVSEPSITDGRVTIDFTSAASDGKGLLVGFFINNGYSQRVKFQNVPLVLIDSDRRILAQQSFRGETIGVIQGGSAKACVVRFKPDHVYTKDIPEGCQVCFDVRPKRSKQPKAAQKVKLQYQALPEDLPENQKQELKRILEKLPPMKRGKVDFSPLCAKLTTPSNLLATVIIRNATDKPLNIEQIPLVIYNAHYKELARGQFDVKSITIEPYKAVLWTFNFEHVLQEKEIDLSSWYIDIQS